MLHVPTTIEDQLILRAIKEECSWESLPKRLQSTLNSKDEWHRRITEHCIKKRLQWNTSFVRKVCREGEYYEDMMRYLRRNLALFPYHLADYVCRVMRISPFRYYCDMIFEVMKNEQPYDSIPNFSAADALRLTGIGRNEFIDIMNKCRSKKIMWKLNKSIAKEALPTHPVDFAIEPWWGVCLVNFTLEEFKKLSEEETATIDKICKEEANAFILFDPVVIKGLHRRGLVYFDVPVYADDRFKVSRLEGFVSNREQSYEDPIEELLYAVFVVSSENSTVAELATTLQAELSQLQAAASFACRLGWAVKLIDPGSILQEQTTSALSDEEEGSLATVASGTDAGLFQQDTSGIDNHGPGSAYARVAFVVDANITSYLMMGSVSPGLKSHAVTLYEAGKLGYASIEDLCKDLSTLEGTKFEGELQEFANHAFSLRCVLECLTSGGLLPDELDMPDIGSSSNEEVTSIVAEISLREESGTVISEPGPLANNSMQPETPKQGSDTTCTNGNNDDVNLLPSKSQEDSSKLDQGLQDAVSPDVGKIMKKVRKYRVDILRCESLATLSSTTLDRLFRRDYDIVVSMVPLPHSSLLPGPKGPVHFGPPSHSSMSPWMNLVLYSAIGSGPVSVVLMKGQCLRLLPAPLAGCEKALVWSWDGSTVAGLGAKFQGNLVKGSILLHCINSLLKHTAVLVQPFSRYDLNKSGNMNTIDVPLPLKNSDGSFADIGKELGLGAEESSKLNSLLRNLADKIPLWTIGYIRILKLFKEGNTNMFAPDDVKYEWVPLCVEFGIPLFSPKLCNYICNRVVSSQLLQTNLFTEHHDTMQELRRRLRDICLEYQATGSSARMLYHRDQPRTQKRQLMTYASQRWNPITEPSSPISGTNDLQRLKLANRQRCHTEVLSFDGNILRSYALGSAYEGTTKMNEEMTSGKVESDDKDSGETVLPGVTLVFDGSELRPFDIGACLQARQPASLIAEASATSSAIK
ncbi:protein FAM91A1-like isoform X1 [Cynara cardunculus var. scolymus]|uniref:protein FAM91A1-like isoform X1 n=2 Tax=Cynara cardunculus var. scolymus TaxID=59895 RepID=UPI000D62B2D4|nr:protein FAM91A1-like isoform X1 [Cynara cardunculus var. scolymus]XP_024969526.1 protein FAM91A1-like isoform X1 [Cynara cardunculus var. scolymus]XP_024969527.1 protein FAM91A1-like isoform X1 [Cynara cardunculus var. scolymus]